MGLLSFDIFGGIIFFFIGSIIEDAITRIFLGNNNRHSGSDDYGRNADADDSGRRYNQSDSYRDYTYRTYSYGNFTGDESKLNKELSAYKVFRYSRLHKQSLSKFRMSAKQ